MRTQHQMRRRPMMIGIALAAATSLLLSGCGRTTEDEAKSSDTKIDDEAATGELVVWTEGGDGAELPQMFEKFKADNPDIEIKMTEIPGEEFASKMTAAITAGTVPDLIYSFTETQPGLLATDGFDPVPEGLVNPDDFFEVIWNNSVKDGVAYGVPWYAYSQFIIYRSDLAEQAGAEVPTDWDSLREFAEKLKDSGVEFPLAFELSYDAYTARQLGLFSVQNGGSFLSEDESEWTINDPKNVEALEFYAGLVQDGLSSPDGPAFLDTVSWSTTGKNAAIVDSGPWFASWFDDANGEGWSDEHMAYAPMVNGPSGIEAATVGGGSWFVPSDAKNKDAAWKFARFMSEPEQQVEWYKIFKNMPALKSAWEDPVFEESPFTSIVEQGLEIGVIQPQLSSWNEVGNVIGQQIERVMRGQITAQEALDEAQKQAESIGMGN